MIKNILEKISKNEFSVKLEEKHLLRLQKYCESIQLVEKSSHWTLRSNHKLISFKKINYLEIGPGSGDLMSIIKDKTDINQIFTIDLAENIPFSFLNIITNFPDSSYLLPNEILNEEQIRKNEFIFLNTKQLNLLPFGYFDIAVNTASMGEMDKLEIKKYLII